MTSSGSSHQKGFSLAGNLLGYVMFLRDCYCQGLVFIKGIDAIYLKIYSVRHKIGYAEN